MNQNQVCLIISYIQIPLVTASRLKLQESVQLMAIKRWFLHANLSLGVARIFFAWPPFIRCRHIMSGIMTKPKKKTPLHHALLHKREWERDHFPSFFPFPHSSWGSTSSQLKKRLMRSTRLVKGKQIRKFSSHEMGGKDLSISHSSCFLWRFHWRLVVKNQCISN